MKKRCFILLFLGLGAMPRGVFAQAVEFQNLSVQPAILCSGSPATVTFQAAMPGNSTGSEDLYLYGTIDSSATVSATSNVFIWSSTSFNATTNTFTGSTTTLSPSYNATWYMATPAFANFVTYTAIISSIPAYTNGTVVYITIGGDDNYVSGYSLPYSIQMAVTVNCTESDAINTGDGVFVNAGVTYTGESNPITVLIDSSGCYSPTPTNTPTPTDTFTVTSTPTNTNTPTDSPTPTNTPTSTDTNTVTNTKTDTDTSTPTNTLTSTPTPINTNTPTNTLTSTDTNTITNTFTSTNTPTLSDTPTLTNTPTNTDTPVPSATATPTFTDTLTNTPTNTPTWTNTPTNSFTPTLTDTPVPSQTPTWTFTATPTYTSTDTATFTDTMTLTLTPTNTFTYTPTLTNTNTFIPSSTPTFTNTSTSTFTDTPTSTPTSSVSMGKSVSETDVHAGNVLTYSIGVTVSGNNVSGMVITDLLPSNMSFVTFGGSPAGTATTFYSATGQLQWTLPSPLAPAVYDLTYQTQINSFAPANVPLVNSAQLSYPGLVKPLTASVPVTVIGNFTVSINIYNSAGEVVKTIPIQSFSTAINNITLSTTNTITTLQGAGSSINILYDGNVIGTWNGTNNSGVPVTNGQYTIQVDNVGSSGVVTSVSQNAMVSRALSSITANVYNGAGELVRTLYAVVDNPIASNMTNVTLSSSVLEPELTGSTTASSGNSGIETIDIQTSATPVTLTWDGTNNANDLVTPGEYTIEVHWNDGTGQTTDISRQVLVVGSTTQTGVVLAEPNVLTSSTTMTTTFDATRVTNAFSMNVKIYTIDGELVKNLTSAGPRISWSASGMASGIYIASVEVDNANGGMVTQQLLKILVMH